MFRRRKTPKRKPTDPLHAIKAQMALDAQRVHDQFTDIDKRLNRLSTADPGFGQRRELRDQLTSLQARVQSMEGRPSQQSKVEGMQGKLRALSETVQKQGDELDTVNQAIQELSLDESDPMKVVRDALNVTQTELEQLRSDHAILKTSYGDALKELAAKDAQIVELGEEVRRLLPPPEVEEKTLAGRLRHLLGIH